MHAIDNARNAEVWQGRVSTRITQGSLEPPRSHSAVATAMRISRRASAGTRVPARADAQSSDWRKSTPSERSLRYRCVRSMPTRFASWPDLAVAQLQLLRQVGTFEMFARLAQRQCEQVLLDQRLVDRRLRRDLALDFLEPDFLRPALDQQPMHQVLQFADVAGPRVIAQAVLRGDAEVAERQAFVVDEPIDVVAQQFRHVLRVIAQRRNAQRQHVQVRKQVEAEWLGPRVSKPGCADDRMRTSNRCGARPAPAL